MKKPRVSDPIERMDLAHMGANGVRSLDVSGWAVPPPARDRTTGPRSRSRGAKFRWGRLGRGGVGELGPSGIWHSLRGRILMGAAVRVHGDRGPVLVE
jgi:hypothetical protein